MDSCQPPAHPGWPSMGSPRRVRRCPWTCSGTARNPPCISSLVTETSGVTSVMSTIVGATAGWGSHMLAVYYMLTGLLRCWHVRSSHVASGVTVTWLVRTDGFFATSRDTTSLDPGDQSSNISSTNIVLQRTILYGRRISLSWPAHRGTCIARSMAMVMPCRSQKVQFDGWHLRKQIFENIENSRNGLISDGVPISSKCQFTTCSWIHVAQRCHDIFIFYSPTEFRGLEIKIDITSWWM